MQFPKKQELLELFWQDMEGTVHPVSELLEAGVTVHVLFRNVTEAIWRGYMVYSPAARLLSPTQEFLEVLEFISSTLSYVFDAAREVGKSDKP
ncbi:MAG: hypothetical protein ACYC3G_00710 [Minisyncoccota bacterium]